MTTTTLDTSYARRAGLLYLLIAGLGGFSIMYVPSVIVVHGDAAATSANLLGNLGLFGLGTVADLATILIEIVLSVMLFRMFRPVGEGIALSALVARLAMVMVMAVNVIINAMPAALLTGAGVAAGLSQDQMQSTALILFEAHTYGISVWDVLFGFHLLLLGYLLFRSGYLPKVFGAAMMAGSFGYLLDGIRHLAFIENSAVDTATVGLLIVASLTEIGFAFWLLIRGLRFDVPTAPAAA